tara:strand:- start:144 stop:386 length:243 start_codon:yes stop_codon:yes gene_type:complete
MAIMGKRLCLDNGEGSTMKILAHTTKSEYDLQMIVEKSDKTISMVSVDKGFTRWMDFTTGMIEMDPGLIEEELRIMRSYP